ncbi:MAG: hypothetical protein ABIP79_03025 [Chitinophagaceae bacterium]
MKFSAIVICIFILSSCTINRKIYSPVEVNNPSLQNKNDYSANLSYGLPSGFDINGGYAITNRIAVTASLFSHKNDDTEVEYNLFNNRSDSSYLLYKHKGIQIGAGLYFPISRDKKTISASFFGGYIKGIFEMREKLYQTYPTQSTSPKHNFYKSDLNRYFLQGSFNAYLPQVHLSFTTRFMFAGYDNVATDYDNNEQIYYRLPPNGNSKWSSFLDFSFNSRFFFSKKEQIGLQISCIANTRLNREGFNFDYYAFRTSLGIVIKTPVKKNK